MVDWLPLDSSSLAQAHTGKKGHGDAVLDIVLSPYDIPEAVRSYYDDAAGCWVVEFRYISEQETLRVETSKDGVTLKVGKHSGRLYRIEVEVVDKAGSLRLFQPKIERALAELQGNEKKWRVLENYSVAKEILAANHDSLLPSGGRSAAALGR